MEHKKWRFFFHYRRSTGGMTVHFRGKCYPCKQVHCFRPTETKYNKIQPFLVMQGYAEEVEVKDDAVFIK